MWNKEKRLENWSWENKYWKPGDVVTHNRPDDCWVVVNGIVMDITPLIQENLDNPEILPILAEAGKDISHWFDADGNFRTFIHPVLGTRVPYLPHGPILHLNDYNLPTTEWKPVPRLSWWKDPQYVVGKLTKSTRPIRIYNVLTKKELTLTVCTEETIEQIMERYSKFNENASSYIWRYDNRDLDMNKTLDENCIPDRKDILRKIGLPDDLYIPMISIYYKDDFGYTKYRNVAQSPDCYLRCPH